MPFSVRSRTRRASRRWLPDRARRTGGTPDGKPHETFHRLLDVDGPFVTFETTYRIGAEASPILSKSRLRFYAAPEIVELAQQAGLSLGRIWGDWDRSALSDSSPEIIVSLQRR